VATFSAGSTPLHVAAIHGQTAIARDLLKAGADVDALGDIGSTPLHQAAFNGHKPMVDLLLKHGADLTRKDAEHNATPLDWAKFQRHTKMVAYLEKLAR
jgi:ankyrin repeat protein